MNNIKQISIITDGNAKRLAITFDVIDEDTGKVIKANKKVNRIVTDEATLKEIKDVEEYAEAIIEEV